MAENDKTRAARSATTGQGAGNTPTGQGAGNAATEASATAAQATSDAARKGAAQFGQKMSDMAESSSRISQEMAQRAGQHFELMMRVAQTMSSGVQAAVSECTEFAQHNTRRQSELMQELSRARTPDQILEVQNRFVREGLSELLSLTEKISRLSADKASEARGHTQGRE